MPDPAEFTDEELLFRFAKGDRASLGVLAQRHENNLVGLASGLLDGHAELAQDAVQEAWMRVIRHARSFAGQSSFRTWMYRIVINRCRDLRPRLVKGVPAATPLPDGAAPTSSEPLRLVAAESGNEEVRAALRALAPATRLLLLLCYHQGLTHPQAAEVLGIPVGTLKSRLSTALAELRVVLGESEKRVVTI